MRRFVTGFSIALLSFVIVNGLSYLVRSNPPSVNDGFRAYGFPLLVWKEGGIACISEFHPAALWGNMAVAVVSSTFAGVFWRKVGEDDASAVGRPLKRD